MKIGVISDTHGVVHAKVHDYFQGVQLIIHCGDIDEDSILRELELIAPVYAVLGNMDRGMLIHRIPPLRVFEFAGLHILVTHVGLDGTAIHPTVKEQMLKEKVDIVCFGHTHLPYLKNHEGRLFINPGGGGRKRFNHPLGVGIIDIEDGKLSAEIINLETGTKTTITL